MEAQSILLEDSLQPDLLPRLLDSAPSPRSSLKMQLFLYVAVGHVFDACA